MITRADLYLLLGDLADNGIEITEQVKKLSASEGVNIEVLNFINDNIPLSLKAFYEKLRKSYNDKHSKLYINIVREEISPQNALITLSALLTQALLFSKTVDNPEMFIKHARCDEISGTLSKYFNTYDSIPCIRLISLIKADLKVMEYIGSTKDKR